MASASEKKISISAVAEEDELEGLFKTFDSQFQDLQAKFSSIERKIQEFRTDTAADEDDGTPQQE